MNLCLLFNYKDTLGGCWGSSNSGREGEVVAWGREVGNEIYTVNVFVFRNFFDYGTDS